MAEDRSAEAHRVMIEALRAMTGEQRLMMAFELSEMTRELVRAGVRDRFPDLSEAQVRSMAAVRILKSGSRNY